MAVLCVSGPAGGRGEADGARARTAAEIWRAADGERGSAQRLSQILTNTASFQAEIICFCFKPQSSYQTSCSDYKPRLFVLVLL